jgi:hypothetical protein
LNQDQRSLKLPSQWFNKREKNVYECKRERQREREKQIEPRPKERLKAAKPKVQQEREECM